MNIITILPTTTYAALTGTTNESFWEAIVGFFKNPVTWIVGAIIALIALAIIVAVLVRRKKLADADKSDDKSDDDNNVKLGEKVGDLDKKVGDLDKKVGDLDKKSDDNNVKLGEKVGDLDKKVGDLDKKVDEKVGDLDKKVGDLDKKVDEKVGDLDKKVGDLDTEVNQQKVAKALVATLPKRERISTELDRSERIIRGEVSKANSLKYQFARTNTSDLAQKDHKVAAYQQAVTFASQMASEFEVADAALRRATARGASDEELKPLKDALDDAKAAKDAAAADELKALKALMTLKAFFKSAIEALKKNFDLQPSIDKVVAQGEELKKIQKWINELPDELTGTAELTELTDKMAEVKAINTGALEELQAKVDDLIADYEAAIADVESAMV